MISRDSAPLSLTQLNQSSARTWSFFFSWGGGGGGGGGWVGGWLGGGQKVPAVEFWYEGALPGQFHAQLSVNHQIINRW